MRRYATGFPDACVVEARTILTGRQRPISASCDAESAPLGTTWSSRTDPSAVPCSVDPSTLSYTVVRAASSASSYTVIASNTLAAT